jgi:hypothetical protein
VLEDELQRIHQELAALGHFVTPSAGPNTSADLDRELARWLAVHPHADRTEAFRAGWARLVSWAEPRVREWEQRWWGARAEHAALRARMAELRHDARRARDYQSD